MASPLASTGGNPERSVDERIALLRGFPGLADAPPAALRSAATSIREERFAAGEIILAAASPDDRLYLIVSGSAEAAVEGPTGPLALATLGPGDLLGEVVPPMPPSRRDVSITAATAVLALRLDAPVVRQLLVDYPPVQLALSTSGENRLEVEFLASGHHFSRLAATDLRHLSERLDALLLAPGATLYRAGESGEACYLLRAGQMELLLDAEGTAPIKLATVSPGAVIGEEIALTEGPYDATARALTTCDVLVVPRADLIATLTSAPSVRDAFIEGFHLRDRPRRVPDVLAHHRTDANGIAVTILKDSRRGAYYRLTEHGRFLWERLDGSQTLRDLTLAYRERFKVFSPALVHDEIDELAAAGFVQRPRLRAALLARPSRWVRVQERLRPIMEHRIPLQRTAALLDAVYRGGARYLFTRSSQLILAAIALAGLALFTSLGGGEAASRAEVPFWVVVPLVMLAIVWHELGHALTAKAFGRDVRLGIGWYWFAPLLYVDTTDTWLSGKWPRIAVSIAGAYASVILGSLAALTAALLPEGSHSQALWLFAATSYFWAIWNLDPLLEYDGYYILADLLDRPNLRRDALRWLGSEMLPAVRRGGVRALDGHLVELSYGVLALAYVVFIAATTVVAYRIFFEGWVASLVPDWIASALGWVLAGITIVAVGVTVAGELRAGRRVR